jgi:hypothetical protein
MQTGFLQGRTGRVSGMPWLVWCLLGCAGSWGDTPLQGVAAEERVVVTLQARDALLTLSSTPGGVRYSVRGPGGSTPASLTLEQLQALDPGLYELVQQATARATLDTEGGFLDASVGVLPAGGSAPGGASYDASRGALRR